MSQIAVPIRLPTLVTAIVVAVTLAVPSIARAQQVVALVDGMPITSLDIQERVKFVQMSTNKQGTPVTPAARQDALNQLIDEILEIKEAHKFSIDPSDEDVNNAFNNVASRMGADAKKLSEVLEKGGASAATLKHKLKAEIAWTSLVRGRYKASLEIPDTDVEAELQLHKTADQKDDVGYEYMLRPVVMIVPQGSPDTAFEARKRDADALRARFENCNDGLAFARGLSEVAVRDQIVKFSADLPQQLRDILNSTDVGHLTPPEQTAEGIQMFALCAKNVTKNDTPGMKEARDELFQKKFGVQAKRYLAKIRKEAMIEYKQANY